MNFSHQIVPYSDLSLDEFHDLAALRISVFVVEQDCPYQELDGLDKEAIHLISRHKDKIVATLRILKPGIAYSVHAIGRVVTSPEYRGHGLGHEIMRMAIEFIEREANAKVPIKLSAQEHLASYYEQHGFSQCGDGYLEDGIPHIPMCRE